MEQAKCRLFDAFTSNQDIDLIPVLVYCSPKVVLFYLDLDKELIQVPDVTNYIYRLA